MSTTYAAGEPPRVVSAAARLYAKCLLVGFALLPAYLIAYLWFFSDPHAVFESHAFHELAIAAATLEGAFVTYVTWVCYRSSGEPLLRWLTLGFLGFAMIYALHGAFTGMAHHNIWLFLLYGPASRLVMSILLLTGLLSYAEPPDRIEKRTRARTWLPWIVFFVIVNVAVAYIAYSPVAGALGTRMSSVREPGVSKLSRLIASSPLGAASAASGQLAPRCVPKEVDRTWSPSDLASELPPSQPWAKPLSRLPDRWTRPAAPRDRARTIQLFTEIPSRAASASIEAE